MPTNGCWLRRTIAERLLLGLLIAAVAAAGCSSAADGGGEVRIAGSDTMLPLNRRLAEAFMRDHPGVAVRVSGGGTGAGVDALLAGRVGLCAASRPFRPDEVGALYDRFGTIGLRFLVARDALSVWVHPDNPVRSLTMEELAAVFSGTADRWSEVGGADEPIEVVIRPASSGTHHFFRDHVLGDADYAPSALVAARPLDVEAAVRLRPAAVGYGGFVPGLDLVQLLIDGAEPSPAAVRRGAYPLSRYLYFFASRPPTGAAADFVDWCLGPEGQRLVAEVGFIPLWVEP